MPKPKKIKRKKKQKHIVINEKVALVHRNDATRVDSERTNARRYRFAPTRMPADNGANFRIKIRKKK